MDPLTVAVSRILRGEVDKKGVYSPEMCFEPHSFFAELATLTPIIIEKDGKYVSERFELIS